MIELTVDPPSVVANISTTEIHTVRLTITVTNASSAPVDASGGVTFGFSVDPGPNVAGGSDSALLLSNLSGNPAASGPPAPLVAVNAAAQTPGWTNPQPQSAAAQLTFRAQPATAAAGSIAANGSLVFTFDDVAADLSVGWTTITVNVLSSAGTPTSAAKPVHKDAAPLGIVSFDAHPAQLAVRSAEPTLDDNQAYLTWATTSAAQCVLSWSPDTGAVVTQDENGAPVSQPNPWPDAPQNPAAQSVLATLTEETTFTLDAYGSGPFVTSSVLVPVSAPTFTAVAITPLVFGLSPASGRTAGGEPVTITGTGFTGATSVSFGPVMATGLTVASDTTITVKAPPGAGPGPVEVTVATPAGVSLPALVSRYGYAAAAAPVVSGVVVAAAGRAAGNPAGGEQVTITGTGFTGATGVSFGTAAAAGVTVDSDSAVTVVAPPGPGTGTGTVDVTVTTANGTSPASVATCYTYLGDSVPFLSAIAGSISDGNVSYDVPLYAGDPAGGETVRITGTTADAGTAIGSATEVQFGAAATTAISPVPGSSDQIDVITPAGVPGSTVDVTVTIPGSDPSPAVPAGRFTYATPLQPVTPGQPFRLIWSCYDGSGPNISWSADAEALVTVVPETAAAAVSSGAPLPTATGSAVAAVTTKSARAAVTASATFVLGQDKAIGGTTRSIIVSVAPLTVISDFTAGQPVTNTVGQQQVTFSWQIVNATGFTLSGGGITPVALPGGASTYAVMLPMPLTPTSYTLTASGFGAAAPYSKTVTVTPNPVALTFFGVSGPFVGPAGQQTVTVSWQAANTTAIVVSAGTGWYTPGVQATSVSVPLPPPAATPPSPAQYPVLLIAEGYQQQSRTASVAPIQVQNPVISANPKSIARGRSTSLTWSAFAATGYQLQGAPYPATRQGLLVTPGVTTTYSLAAEGYTTGTQYPVASVTVIVLKDGTDGKEFLAEKQPFVSAGPDDPVPAEPPGGGAEAFIISAERPEVGTGLIDNPPEPFADPAPAPPGSPPVRDE